MEKYIFSFQMCETVRLRDGFNGHGYLFNDVCIYRSKSQKNYQDERTL